VKGVVDEWTRFRATPIEDSGRATPPAEA